MAFNLNKNDESKPKLDLSKKATSTSKFDLSKNDAATSVTEKAPSKFDLSKKDIPSTVTEEVPAKSKTGVLVVLGILLLGGGIWYFQSRGSNDVVNDKSSSPTVESTAGGEPSNGTNGLPDVKTDSTTTTTTSGSSTSSNVDTDQNTASTSSESVEDTSVKPSSSDVSSENLNNKVSASFSKASASFTKIDETVVKDIISFLEKNPNASITVNGYASSEGELAANQRISQSRAIAFKKYLASKGIKANRINAVGKGVDNPIASNDNEEGRKLNRRVEISVQ